MFKGRRRARYEEAASSLDDKPLIRSDANVKAFIKAEKTNPGAKVNPDPRMIQACNARYNLELGRYLKAFEHDLYKLRGPTGLRAIAKGLNQRERASLLLRKLAQFRSPVVFSLDASRWDQHVSEQILQIEHAFYLKVLYDPWFAKLLSWQLVNRCFTSNGVRWLVRGNRMSGHMNTALGNCLLMVLMITAAMKSLRIKKWDLLDDGDDCLLIIESQDEALVQANIKQIFLEFGQELKLENRATDPRDVIFCQTRMTIVDGVPLMLRDWRKVLSQACCGNQRWLIPKLVRSMFHAVGSCELALGVGVPILQEFALACLRNGDGTMPTGFADDEPIYQRMHREMRAFGFKGELSDVKARPVSSESRLEFERTWGVSIQDQLDIEEILRGWQVEEVSAKAVHHELDAKWRLDLSVEDPLAPFWQGNFVFA
jgi:hypothetical protein